MNINREIAEMEDEAQFGHDPRYDEHEPLPEDTTDISNENPFFDGGVDLSKPDNNELMANKKIKAYTKKNLINVAGKDELRPALIGINFTKDYTESCDGTRLIRVSTLEVDGNSIPKQIVGVQNLDSNIILPANKCNDFKNVIPTKQPIPMFENFFVSREGQDIEMVSLMASDLKTAEKKTVTAIDAVWPDTQAFVDAAEKNANFKIAFNIDYMINMLQSLKRFDKKIGNKAVMELNVSKEDFNSGKGNYNPIMFRSEDKQGQKMIAILMPMRID